MKIMTIGILALAVTLIVLTFASGASAFGGGGGSGGGGGGTITGTVTPNKGVAVKRSYGRPVTSPVHRNLHRLRG
jgi:hypothetical protein